MARLASWLSPQLMPALGWALIHSLWQGLACAAAAAALMALSCRPSVRYLVGVGALAAMLAAPIATFLVMAASPGAPLTAPVVSQGPAAPIVPRPAASAPPHGKSQDMKGALEAVAPVLEKAPASNILPWLVAAWLCGVAFFSLRFAGGFLLLEHLRRNQSTIPGAGLLVLCQDVQRQLGLERGIEYLECARLQTPAVIGWLRPAVLIPLTALTGLSEAQLRAVIAHELAHIRRFDLLVNLFQIFVETLLFYHPAMWWLNKRIRAERELCCDEIAVAASGNRLEYAKALALMAEWESAPRLAMAANRGPLTERIFHILGRKSASAGQRMLGITGSVLFLVAALVAANALFTIAAPPIAQAKESVKAALSASQTTVAHLARQVFRTDEPATPSSQEPRTASTLLEADRRETDQDQKLTPPLVNLSGLLPIESLPAPTVLASNSLPAKTQSNQPAAPVAATEVSAASTVTNASGPKTEAGIRCLLGLGPDGCWRRFETTGARQSTIYCATAEWGEGGFCPLQSIEYVGINATGEDVYSVKFMHRRMTYVVRPPGLDGRIARFCISPGSRVGASPGSGSRVDASPGSRVGVDASCFGDRNTPPSEMTVVAPAGPAQILYTRPAEGRASAVTSGAANARPAEGSGHASAAPSDAATKPLVMATTPTGAGDPNVVVCRAPQQIPGSGQLGPQVCLHNYEWLKVAVNGKDIAPDGKILIDGPTGNLTRNAVAGPAPGTVEAMRCLNRQGPKGCETMFVGQARQMAQAWVFDNPNRDFSRGSFVSSNYEGRATGSNYMDAMVMSTLPATEMNIFRVKFTHAEYTFYVSAADADGKIHALGVPLLATSELFGRTNSDLPGFNPP